MPGEESGLIVIRTEEQRKAVGLELSGLLSALIVAERRDRGWNQTKLGERLGMQQSGIATWERGGTFFGHLHLHNILALEDVFEWPRGSILYRLGAASEKRVDFPTFVMACEELDFPKRALLRETYRLITEGSGGG